MSTFLLLPTGYLRVLCWRPAPVWQPPAKTRCACHHFRTRQRPVRALTACLDCMPSLHPLNPRTSRVALDDHQLRFQIFPQSFFNPAPASPRVFSTFITAWIVRTLRCTVSIRLLSGNRTRCQRCSPTLRHANHPSREPPQPRTTPAANHPSRETAPDSNW